MCRTVPLVLLLPMILCERAPGETPRPILLKAARVFDGAELATHDDWVVLVRGERIESVGPADQVQCRRLRVSQANLHKPIFCVHTHPAANGHAAGIQHVPQQPEVLHRIQIARARKNRMDHVCGDHVVCVVP